MLIAISEHIRNSRVKHDDQVTKELEHLSKFYKPENGGLHKELAWWIAMADLAVVSAGVLSTARLVRVNST